MAEVRGTGLPVPKTEVIADPGKVIDADAYSSAKAWAGVASAGAQIADAGFGVMAQQEHQARVGYLADQENEIERQRVERRDKFQNDPAGFDADWKGYS